MKVAIHQPNYLPWAGFWDKMDRVNKFILLDTAMFTKSEFIHRNKVKTPEGSKWLTVPIKGKQKPINQLLIENKQKWRASHWTVIYNSYKKSPYFNEYREGFERIYQKKWIKLADLNVTLIHHLKEILEIDTEIIKESDFNVDFGTGNTRNINIIKQLQADRYISGIGAKVYNDEKRFEKNNIQLIYQQFNPPVYPQRWGKFKSHMSIIDMLFNCGPNTMKLIRSSRDTNNKT
ncbi:WbqC family protein [Virgibacillus sp. W0430]|uniref:WbqC family protein n=1 Tax=Virgibacillus sp. W0430 TaxID=3391580 RepID=UPI003F455CD9